MNKQFLAVLPSIAADFFVSTVSPTVNEFLSTERDIRRGRLSAIVLYHMADYWNVENGGSREKLTQLHKALIDECPDFVLIRDVADATKHAELRQQNAIPRTLSSSQQVTPAAPGLFEAPFGVGVFAEASKVMLKLDDGNWRNLAPAVRSVLAMWEKSIGPPKASFK